MEAIILAGGKAERLGDAAAGRPKSLVPVGGKPLLAWQIGRLHGAGVSRVIVSCMPPGRKQTSSATSSTPESRSCAPVSRSGSAVAEPSALPPSLRQETGDVLAMNGDELVAVDFVGLLARHRATGAAATVTVAQPLSQFGQVELGVTMTS